MKRIVLKVYYQFNLNNGSYLN